MLGLLRTRGGAGRATALAAAVAAAAIAGCGGGGESGGGATAATTAGNGAAGSAQAAATPRGTRPLDSATWWVYYRAPYTLDPIKLDDYPEDQIIGNMCESLLRTTADYRLEPGLAASWSNPDPRTWVYELREEARFWNGRPVTAEDVVFSLERNLDPALASFYRTPYLNVASIRATGPREVTIRLKRPDYTFHARLGSLGAAVIEKAFTERAGDRFGTPDVGVMCSGPFQLDSWNGSTDLTLRADPGYWDPELRPRLKRLRFVWPQDATTVSQGFAAGSFDGGFGITPSLIPSLRAATNGTLSIGDDTQTLRTANIAVLNMTDGPLASRERRQALSKAIDRDGLVSAIWQGAATPLYATATPGFWGYARDIWADAYEQLATGRDVEGARRLAEQAGRQERPIVLATSTVPAAIEEASVIAESAKEAGLDVEVRQLPADQYGELFGNRDARRGIDMLITNSFDHAAEPLLIYTAMATPGGVTNYGGYDNPQVTRLLARARATADEEERARIGVEAQRLIAEDLPWIPLVTPSPTLFQSDRITGAPRTLAYLNSPWAAHLGAP
ncbi:ABC transporter substrate-binding protein [Conexibacter arvalis]|nr:ABC transporter substrate-binding protein [Conexibacter arvalis]